MTDKESLLELKCFEQLQIFYFEENTYLEINFQEITSLQKRLCFQFTIALSEVATIVPVEFVLGFDRTFINPPV